MNTQSITSPFGFHNDREMSNIDTEIMFKHEKPAQSSSNWAAATTHETNLEKISTHSSDFTSQLQTNPSRLSRRISMAIKTPPKTSRHARKRSDLTELLCEAAATGNTQLIGRILGAGGDIKKQNEDGLTALHVAAMGGQGDAVRCLVRMGADIESKDAQGYSPLHRAVLSNRVSLISHLANLGADLHAMDAKGWTGLHISAASGPQVTSSSRPATSLPQSRNTQLRFSVAFPDQMNNHRRPSIASHRSTYDECSVIEALNRSGASLETRNKQGETPLHVAVRHGNLENVRLLLDQGAQINARDSSGMTPLAIISNLEECNDELSSLLLARGAEVTPMEQPKSTKGSWFWRAVL